MAQTLPADFTVVIVSDFGHVNGGAAQVAIASAVGLAQRGLAVKFLYAVGPLDPQLEQAGVCAVRIQANDVWSEKNPFVATLHGIWNREAATSISKFISGFDPTRTVIHFHQWTKAFSPSAIAAGLRLGLPAVITLHDYFFACPNGAYYNFQTGQPCQLEPMSTRCLLTHCDSKSRAHKLVRVARHIAQTSGLKHRRSEPCFVFPSELAQDVCARFLPARSRSLVIPYPVSLPDVTRVPAETNREYFFVGRLTREKGCLAFARASREAGVAATFVGSGTCEQEIRDINPEASILGWVPKEQVASLLQRARALVFASRWYETFGLVCAEALGIGVPVLAAKTTGAAGLIEDGLNGATFEPQDEIRLVELLRWMEQPDVVQRLSLHAYQKTRPDIWTLDRHVDALSNLYASVTQDKEVEFPEPATVEVS